MSTQLHARWDDAQGIVHALTAPNTAGILGWYFVCSGQGPVHLHVNSRACVATTCLWCVLGIRGPYRFDEPKPWSYGRR